MAIQCNEHHRVGIIAVEGDFAGEYIDVARKALDAWQARRAVDHVLFDLARTTFVDSQGLATMTRALALCQPAGGKVLVAGADDNCRKILEMTRLDHRVESYPDAGTALKMAQ